MLDKDFAAVTLDLFCYPAEWNIKKVSDRLFENAMPSLNESPFSDDFLWWCVDTICSVYVLLAYHYLMVKSCLIDNKVLSDIPLEGVSDISQ